MLYTNIITVKMPGDHSNKRKILSVANDEFAETAYDFITSIFLKKKSQIHIYKRKNNKEF